VHPTPAFHYDDRAEALAFVAAHPFAMLAVNGEQGPVTAQVPLVIDVDKPILLGHVARANPFWEAVQKGGGKAVAVFQGVDAYVSPSSYPSKKIHGKVVPTWNYVAVEIRGTIKVETRAEAMASYIEALTNKMEARRKPPWQVSDAPEDYIAKLSHGIVGFSLDIEDITHVRKLSQNKSFDDKLGVMKAFEVSSDRKELLVAREMRKEF